MTFRCSNASRDRDEPLFATASTVPAFLLLEDPGPWGPHILRSRRLPDALRATLRGWQRDLGLRTLLIRRPGRDPGGPRRVFVASARHAWLETTTVDDLGAVGEFDLSGVNGPDGVGLTAHAGPVLLACTHGAHDRCCAERGRPLAAALARRWPEELWEASHLGGDRFAGNLVALPRGDYFGGLDADTGPDVVARYLDGELDLAHHRGRSSHAWVVQAAVHAARERFGALGVRDVVVRDVGSDAEGVVVRLSVRGEDRVARVHTQHGEAAHLTCSASHTEPPLRHLVTWLDAP